MVRRNVLMRHMFQERKIRARFFSYLGYRGAMKPISTITVSSDLPSVLEPLRDLALNLRWTWRRQTVDLFRSLDPRAFAASGENPIAMLPRVPAGRLAEAARTGKAKSEELSGSTLTVTSLGPLGVVATTPVINRPEVAIIGPNKIVERPMFRGDDIVRAKLMNLSISCDHRVVDGWDAASYVQAVRKLLETPVLLFAD